MNTATWKGLRATSATATEEALLKELQHRHDQLVLWAKPEPRLKQVGEDTHGTVWVDLNDWT